MKKLTAAQEKALAAIRASDGQQNILFFEAQGIRAMSVRKLSEFGLTEQRQRADGSYYIVAL
jgi:hypothetical protein